LGRFFETARTACSEAFQKKIINKKSQMNQKLFKNIYVLLFFGGRGARPGSASGCFKKPHCAVQCIRLFQKPTLLLDITFPKNSLPIFETIKQLTILKTRFSKIIATIQAPFKVNSNNFHIF
jgi:hypothetical protein